jgi:hypothetical protein
MAAARSENVLNVKLSSNGAPGLTGGIGFGTHSATEGDAKKQSQTVLTMLTPRRLVEGTKRSGEGWL